MLQSFCPLSKFSRDLIGLWCCEAFFCQTDLYLASFKSRPFIVKRSVWAWERRKRRHSTGCCFSELYLFGIFSCTVLFNISQMIGCEDRLLIKWPRLCPVNSNLQFRPFLAIKYTYRPKALWMETSNVVRIFVLWGMNSCHWQGQYLHVVYTLLKTPYACGPVNGRDW